MVRWSSRIQDGDRSLSLDDWLRENYQKYDDDKIARAFSALGIQAAKETIRSRRRTLGLTKIRGSHGTEAARVPELGRATETSSAGALGVDQQALLDAIRDKPCSLKTLSTRFDRSEATVKAMLDDLRETYNVVTVDGDPVLDTKAPPKQKRKLETLADRTGMQVHMAWMADLHAGSKHQQITNAQRFIQLAFDAGVRDFFVAGDLSDGHNVYRGQFGELYAIGAEAQLVALDYSLPRIDGVRYYVIGGNHDMSFIRAAGFNLPAALAARRPDIVYLGFDVADVPITDQAHIRLWHPSGGVPYALSYRMQKALEAAAFGELIKAIESGDNSKLRGVCAGHLHVTCSMWRGPILGAQVGCFQAQTPYLAAKALFPQLGAYIVTWRLTDGGLIQESAERWIAFTEIGQDYLNHEELLDRLAEIDSPPDCETLYIWKDGETT